MAAYPPLQCSSLRLRGRGLANPVAVLIGVGISSSIGGRAYASCPADLNGDQATTMDDLALLLSDFGCSTANCTGDLDGDGETGIIDLTAMLSSLGCTNCGEGWLFEYHPAIETPYFPVEMVARDMEGDGDLDAAILCMFCPTVVLRNDGNGNFERINASAVGHQPRGIVFRDLDRDGDADLAVAALEMSQVEVCANINGAFPSVVRYTFPSVTTLVRSANFDGVLGPDLAVVAGPGVYVRWNDGSGGFPNQTTVGEFSGLGLPTLTPILMNNDGAADLLVAVGTTNPQLLLYYGGGQAFNGPWIFPTSVRADVLFAGDLDGDGDQDVALASAATDEILVFWNQSGLNLVAGPRFATSDEPRDIAAGDVDGDGHVDLLTVGPGESTVIVHRSRGDRTFGPPERYSSGGGERSLVVGDFDGDGRDDVLVTVNGAVDFLRNRCD